MIAEIVGPSGRVHYRRPTGDPLVSEALRTPGYSVRYVESETVEPPYVPNTEQEANEDAYRDRVGSM